MDRLSNANRSNPANAYRGHSYIYTMFDRVKWRYILVWTDGVQHVVIGPDPWTKTVGRGI
jgi:hypothetical protein